MKKIFLLSITLLTISLSAASEEEKKLQIPMHIENPNPSLTFAVFWCKYCKKDLQKSRHINLASHLPFEHKRCGTCEKEFPSPLEVRLHEASHATTDSLRLQNTEK